MARFRYRAVDGSGAVVEGDRDAPDETTLVRGLRAEGLLPLEVRDRGARMPAGQRGWFAWRRRPGRLTGEGRIAFTRALASLAGAGLRVDQALGAIAGQPQGGAAAAVARRLLDRLRRGVGLAQAMEAEGDIFPPFYVALVRAGEAGDALAPVLDDLVRMLDRAHKLETELRSALTYPQLVLAATAVATVILLAGVIPEFEPLFDDRRDALPTSTRLVLTLSHWVQGWWREAAIAVLVMMLALPRLARLPALRRWRDAWLLRLPLVGDVIAMADGARFCRALATLTQNGVDIIPALEMSAGAARNAVLARAFGRIVDPVRRGEGIVAPLDASGALPAMAMQVIAAGEAGGRLAPMLSAAAEMLERDLSRDTQRIVALIAPAVTLLLGALVALIVGSIVTAIMNTYALPL